MNVLIKNILVIVIVVLFCLNEPVSVRLIGEKLLPALENNELYVAFLSIPDGEATLIKTKQGKNFLINTGSEKSEEELFFQLKELDVQQIDALILTKQTLDYCGNANRIIERYNIKKTIYTGQLSTACNEQVVNTSLTKWNLGVNNQLSDQLHFKVLQAEANGEMSLGIMYGNTSIMYLSNGDVNGEEQLLRHQLDPEILKIGDYARGKSPSVSLLKEIDPHISIVFDCKDCKPNEGLIERLNESWIDVYRLRQVGTTIIQLNLHDYEVIS